MAGWLKPGAVPRAWALALLVLPVLLLHLWLGSAVRGLQQAWSEAAAPMPPRLSVSYVRELKAAVPAAAVVPNKAPHKTAAPPRRLPAEPADSAASAPPPAPEPMESIASSEPLEPIKPIEPLPAAVNLAALAEPGPEWPLSTRLDYELTGNYRGAVTGQASVEWIRRGRRYQIHLDVAIGPGFAPLMARRMSSEGLLSAQGIVPQRYDEDTRVLFAARRRSTILFEGEQLRLGDGRLEPAPAGVQDASSQFVQLTWLFLTGREQLRAGRVVELPLALPRRQYRWRYEVLGEQQLATPMGSLATWHLKPMREAGGGDLTAEVWLAPSLQYLPVRLRIHQDAQTFIDLLLKAPPRQEAGTAAP